MELLMFSAIGRDIQWASLGIAAAILLVVSLLLGVLIVIISRFCQVKEDPRVKEVENLLAGSNCGACGHPGCAGAVCPLSDVRVISIKRITTAHAQ